MTKDLTLKLRFRGQWHDRIVLEHAINHIVGKLKTITKAGLWLEISRKMELASFDSGEEIERLSTQLRALGQQRTEANGKKWDELQAAIRAASVFTVTLSNKECKILWRELLRLPPTAFGRSQDASGQLVESLPTTAGLGIMFTDIAEQFGFSMPEIDYGEDEEEGVA